jgi:alpha-beta hydrolase superfamily lysophospholipase
MLALLTIKMLSIAALAVGLNSPAFASELKPVSQTVSQTTPWQSVSEYKIDQSPRPVVVAWNAGHPEAFMVAVHGFGLHKGSFEQFALAMQDRNVSTYSLDVRGFGGWASRHNKALDFEQTSEDLTALISSIRTEHPGKPIFLIGESMGGAIALDYSAQHPQQVDGVISSVPGSDRFNKFRTALKVGTSFILTGGNTVSLKHVLVDRVFNDKQLQRNWQTDPDSKLSFRLGELLQLTKFMKHAELAAAHIDSLPILVVQGSRDRLVRPEANEKIFDELKTSDKQLVQVENGEHLTFEDGQFDDKVVAQVQDWVTKHTNAPVLSASAL